MLFTQNTNVTAHHLQRCGSTSHKAFSVSGENATDLALVQYVSISAMAYLASGCLAAVTSALA